MPAIQRIDHLLDGGGGCLLEDERERQKVHQQRVIPQQQLWEGSKWLKPKHQGQLTNPRFAWYTLSAIASTSWYKRCACQSTAGASGMKCTRNGLSPS